MKHAIKFTPEARAIIRKPGCFPRFQFNDDAEFERFIARAERAGLDPLAKQIVPTRRQGVMVVIIPIDAYRLVAARTGEYAGSDDAVITYDDKKKITKATVTVYRAVAGVRCPFTATAHWSEYVVTGKAGTMWSKMPHAMISKCAEALALRKAFPEDLTDSLTEDEIEDELPRTGVAPLNEASYDNTAPPGEPPPEPEPETDQVMYRKEYLTKASNPLLTSVDRDKAATWAKSDHSIDAWEKALSQLSLKILNAEQAAAKATPGPEVPLDQIGKPPEDDEASNRGAAEAATRALFEPNPDDPDGLTPDDRALVDQMMIEIEDAIAAITQHLKEHPSDKKGQRSFDTIVGYWNGLTMKSPADVKRMHKQVVELAGEVG